MIACDICGTETGPHGLTALLEDFRVDGIKDVCGECRAEIERVAKPVHSRALKATMNIWSRAAKHHIRRMVGVHRDDTGR